MVYKYTALTTVKLTEVIAVRRATLFESASGSTRQHTAARELLWHGWWYKANPILITRELLASLRYGVSSL
jgi:hypothetical protein